MTALREAYELIRDPERWTQGTLARDSNGIEDHVDSPSAVRWCARGAALRSGASRAELKYLDALSGELFPDQSVRVGGESITRVTSVNDKLGHEAALQVLEKAIVQTEGGL